MAPEVRILSQFRDKYLLTNTPGKAFVRFYYRHSPPIADRIRNNGFARAVVRKALRLLIRVTAHIVE